MKPLLQKAPRAQSLWSHPDFRLVMPARAVSFLGDAITLIVLALKIAETDQPLRITVVYAAFALPLFALAPWAGRIVDEYDSRLVLVLAGSLQVVGSLGLVLAPTFGAIVGAVLVLQIGQSVTQPAWSALVPRIVGDDLVGKAMGLQQSLTAAAGLAGAAVGGALYAALGYRDAILCDTVTFALLVVVGGLVRTRRGRRYDAGLPRVRPKPHRMTSSRRAAGRTAGPMPCSGCCCRRCGCW